jgi:hypothetical protein
VGILLSAALIAEAPFERVAGAPPVFRFSLQR